MRMDQRRLEAACAVSVLVVLTQVSAQSGGAVFERTSQGVSEFCTMALQRYEVVYRA